MGQHQRWQLWSSSPLTRGRYERSLCLQAAEGENIAGTHDSPTADQHVCTFRASDGDLASLCMALIWIGRFRIEEISCVSINYLVRQSQQGRREHEAD
jgi:hypothetical protein